MLSIYSAGGLLDLETVQMINFGFLVAGARGGGRAAGAGCHYDALSAASLCKVTDQIAQRIVDLGVLATGDTGAILYEKSFNLKQSLEAILATLERIIRLFSLMWPTSP